MDRLLYSVDASSPFRGCWPCAGNRLALAGLFLFTDFIMANPVIDLTQTLEGIYAATAHDMVADPAGAFLYVSGNWYDEGTDEDRIIVKKLSLPGLGLIDTLTVGLYPDISYIQYMCIDATHLYIADDAHDKIWRVLLSDFATVQSVTLAALDGFSPYGLATTTDDDYVYVFTEETLVRVNKSTFTQTGSIAITGYPAGSDIYQSVISGGKLYLGSYGSSRVEVLGLEWIGPIYKIDLATFTQDDTLIITNEELHGFFGQTITTDMLITHRAQVYNGFAYFFNDVEEGILVWKIDLSNFTQADVILLTQTEAEYPNHPQQPLDSYLDVAEGMLYLCAWRPYLGTGLVTTPASVLAKIDLSDFSFVGYTDIVFAEDPGNRKLQILAGSGNYLYTLGPDESADNLDVARVLLHEDLEPEPEPEESDHRGSERLDDDYRIVRNIFGLHDPMVQGVLMAAKMKRKRKKEQE